MAGGYTDGLRSQWNCDGKRSLIWICESLRIVLEVEMGRSGCRV